MADEIIIPIVAEVGNKKSYKSIQEYTNYLESQLDSAIDTSLLNPLDKAGKKWNALIKQGRKYREIIVTTTKKGKLKTFNITDKQYSLAEARKLMSASSLYGAKSLRTDIQVERRNQPKKQKRLTQEEVARAEQEEINKLQTESNSKLSKIKALSNIIGGELTGVELARFKLNSAKKELNELEKQFKLVKEGDASYVALSEKIKTTQKRINELTVSLREQNQKALDEKKMSGWDKFLRRFKSYFTIRIFRNFFSAIEKGFSESLTNIAKFDSGVNDTMSTITSSFTILSNSLASVVVPLLELVEPALTRITEVVAKMAEGISYLIAKLIGSATYLKANTKYTKDFSNAMSQLSFDKFETLNGSDGSGDPYSMFEKVEVEGANIGESLKGVKDELVLIGSVIAGISASKLLSFIAGKGFTSFSSAFKAFGSNFGTFATKVSGFAGIIGGIYLIVDSITSMIDWNKETTGLEKFLDVLRLVLGVVAMIAGAVAIIKGKTLAGGIAGAVAVTAVLAGIATGVAKNNIKTYANGGIVDSGSLFVAGEAGAELVTTMPSGKTGVTNIAQFKQATFEALTSWWEYARYDLPETAQFSLDGAQIARSKSFKNELNRTNAGLNLR